MDLTKQEISTLVKKSISEFSDFPPEDIYDNSNLSEDLEMDSLDQVELLMDLEEKIHLEIPDDDAKALHTVKDIIIYIEDHLHD